MYIYKMVYRDLRDLFISFAEMLQFRRTLRELFMTESSENIEQITAVHSRDDYEDDPEVYHRKRL